MEELTYDELRRIHAREKMPNVSAIQPDFYRLAGRLLSTYDKSDATGMREYNNVLKILKYIYYRRLEKIVNASINSFKGVESPPEMLPREREVYERIVALIRADEKTVDSDILIGPLESQSAKEMGLSNAQAASEKQPVVEVRDMFSLVKITKDVEEFVGLNGKTYGPYRANDEAELPPEEADMLVQMESAVKVQKKE